MFIHLLATLALGAIAAGLVWVVARTIGRKVPSFLYPAAVAAGMLSYAVYDEYSWYSRVANGLPPQLQVVRTYATSLPYQPWTYAFPRVYKFDALDRTSARQNPKAPNLRLVRIARVTRNTSTVEVMVLVDCAGGRFMEVLEGTAFGDDGLPENPKWQPLSGHKQLRALVCGAVALRALPHRVETERRSQSSFVVGV